MKKTTSIILTIITLFSLMIGTTGFNKIDLKAPKKFGIDRLDIVSATGDKINPNVIKIHNHWNPEYSKMEFDESLLSNDKAVELINEIKSIPEEYGDKDDAFAFSVSMDYYDENEEEHHVYRTCYGSFPDNWSTIVSLVGEVTEGTANLDDRTEIVTIDADYIRENSDVNEDLFPEGVTLEDVIDKYPISYTELYCYNYSVLENNLNKYLFDYYDLASHKITNETTAENCSFDELREFAEEKMDTVTEEREVSICGKYQNYDVEIIKFDSFDKWKTNPEIKEILYNDDGTIDVRYEIDAGCEGMTVVGNWNLFVDPSHKFVISTECNNSRLLYEFLSE